MKIFAALLSLLNFGLIGWLLVLPLRSFPGEIQQMAERLATLQEAGAVEAEGPGANRCDSNLPAAPSGPAWTSSSICRERSRDPYRSS